MSPLRVLRFIGWVLVVLGVGSAIMRTTMNMDTVLTNWMGAWQPWSGIAMAVVGAVCVAVAITGRKRQEDAEVDSE